MAGSKEIEQIAATWLARRDSGRWSPQDQARLDAWLEEATAHRVAFIRLDAVWQQSDRLKILRAGRPAGAVPATGTWSPMRSRFAGETRRRRATAWAPRTASAQKREAPIGHPPPWWRYPAALAVAVVIVALAVGWRQYAVVERASFQTAVGELREVPLADGSSAMLSSDSCIAVAFSRGERHVDLQRGEAFFTVAKNPSRPFVVNADGRRVIAVGTRFAVRRDQADLRVVVTEGVVRLEPGDHAGRGRQPTTLLPAGSVALASDAGVVVHADSVQQAETYLDWRNGFVSFHDTPLVAAVAEFNRYNVQKIVIADTAAGRLRIGGNFRWSNTDAFVRLLEQGFPIRAERRGDTVVLHRR
ncbi:MAG TPA: FecR domain-containing protein [Rhodanobacter sp.]|jgi:transmembrane sensor|nr:FecR domain-containing protein [Rhodanobacter sp.]